MKRRPGFIARGGFAIFLLILFTIIAISEAIDGNTEALGNWLVMILVSALFTFISIMLNKNKK